MRRILVISSLVAQDAVGLTPTIAPLQQAGLEVVPLPTVVLSNHPARARCAGTTIAPHVLEEMSGAIDANGWLGTFDAILSGYLPTKEHADWVHRLVVRMRALNPGILYVCDPILGDDPDGLYIDSAAARAVRELLMPSADVLTPNRFELSWLSGVDVSSVDDSIRAARSLDRPKVAATSIPSGSGELANVLVSDGNVFVAKVDTLPDVPHGTGDLFAGFFTGQLLAGVAPEPAFRYAVDGVELALGASRGSDRLLLPLIDWAKLGDLGAGPVR